MLRVLDLFSGIGGFSLGLERTGGFRTVAFCEIEPYCRAVLRKHWPEVPCHGDIRSLRGADVGPVDVICGGFPCQDISTAGKGAGLAGERSGLWSEYRRLIEECRPSWVIVENVSVLRSRGLDTVLGEISALGYDAEWHCIPASAVGAPHRRDRVWIVAHADIDPRFACRLGDAIERTGGRDASGSPIGSHVADAGHDGPRRGETSVCDAPAERNEEVFYVAGCGWWASEPDVGRVANGVPSRVDRLRALGNAVVPQIPEIIGRAILEAEAMSGANSYCSKEKT
jgi:DNA (cytosine-5)-methyltransferase 1